MNGSGMSTAAFLNTPFLVSLSEKRAFKGSNEDLMTFDLWKFSKCSTDVLCASRHDSPPSVGNMMFLLHQRGSTEV